MTKYDEVMEKLEVTPEMRARILQNVETQMAEPCKKPEPAPPLRRAGRVPCRFAHGRDGAAKIYFQSRSGGVRDDGCKRYGRGNLKRGTERGRRLPGEIGAEPPVLPTKHLLYLLLGRDGADRLRKRRQYGMFPGSLLEKRTIPATGTNTPRKKASP